ncbi:hypothetical protein DRP05_07445 [Archaeoglobales archaeon]|nr:MAG: hypothetical protein DRP05_07445 [Archaeoglobales archaeon]
MNDTTLICGNNGNEILERETIQIPVKVHLLDSNTIHFDAVRCGSSRNREKKFVLNSIVLYKFLLFKVYTLNKLGKIQE